MDSADASILRFGGMELRFLVDETKGSGDLVIFEMTVLPNARVPVPHYHRDVDEVVFGLSGIFTSKMDGKTHEIRGGDCLKSPQRRDSPPRECACRDCPAP